jgi:Uncharacterized protein involved in exopolysaccharide biosynthesis
MTEMNSKCIVKLLLKNKLNILIILVLAVVLAILFSSQLFIKPLYKSSVILYPTTTYSASKAVMNTNNLIYVDPLEIGDESQTEHMMQILNSGIIRDKIIEKYDLMNHYGIDNNCEYKQSKLIKAYEDKIRIKRTEYNSVKIIVLDTDPEIASNIANDIAALFDETMNEMQREISAKAFEIVEREYNNTIDEINVLEDSLKYYREKGIYNYDIQINTLSQQLATELAKGNDKGAKNIENQINKLSQNGHRYNDISNDIKIKKDYLTLLKTKYDDARLNATETIPHKLVITNAYISDKPVYPIRWVIVTVTFFATLIIIIMVLAAFEYSENKNNKQDE